MVSRNIHTFWTIFSCDQAALWMVQSVHLSIRLPHFFTMSPSSYQLSSWNFQELLPMTEVRSMQKVKVKVTEVKTQFSRFQTIQFEFTYGDEMMHKAWCCLEGHTAKKKNPRHSENDNTPQLLDQWTNSPFIGQQVWNCKSFTLTHYLADLFDMHHGHGHGPRSIPLCIQHYNQLTYLSFQVSRPSHSWDTAISIFYLANPRSRSWVRSKFKVTMWV